VGARKPDADRPAGRCAVLMETRRCRDEHVVALEVAAAEVIARPASLAAGGEVG